MPMNNIQPFKINIPQAMLDNLKSRLANTRWPDEISNSGWDYGTNLAYLKNLTEYWKNEFDWRAQEKMMNSFEHFHANIEGINIHYIHERGKGPNPTPLIITHGWPSSFAEMLKIIPLLTDNSFDVIIPSLPGFGFSDKPSLPGWNVQKIASVWMKLMTETLGYDKFFAEGGDWGGYITARLGFAYPEHIFGIYTSNIRGTPTKPYPGTPPLSAAESAMLQAREHWFQTGASYWHMQSTAPQTPAYALNDSPVGLASWILEKWRDWTDCDGDLEKRFTKDELLTNITIYWFTQTINSSMRLYYENHQNPWVLGPGERVMVPCGMGSFPHEGTLREWAERFFNIQHWTEFERGGHFPAIEEPELLARDLTDFCRHLR